MANVKLRSSLLRRAGIAALKGSASAAMGSSIAVTEVEAGDTAAKGMRAGLAVLGLAGEILLDSEENPMLCEAAKASLHSAASVTAYAATKKAAIKAKAARAAKAKDSLMADLKADLESDDAETADSEAAEPATVAKKRTKKAE